MNLAKKVVLGGALAVAAIFTFGATSQTAEAGGCGLGLYAPAVNVYHAPVVDVYHAPIIHHTCVYKVFIYDCGVLRCAGTYYDPFIAKRKALLLELNGYDAFVRKVIL